MRSIHPSSDCTGRNEHLQICRLVEMRPYLQDTPIKKLFRRWRLLQTSHKKHQLAEWLERHGQLKPCLEAGSSQLAVVWIRAATPFFTCQPHLRRDENYRTIPLLGDVLQSASNFHLLSRSVTAGQLIFQQCCLLPNCTGWLYPIWVAQLLWNCCTMTESDKIRVLLTMNHIKQSISQRTSE